MDINNIYIMNKLDNEDIILKKININIEDYIIIDDGKDILCKKMSMVKIDNIEGIKKYNFCNSNILNCVINDDIFTDKCKYKSILKYIYQIIDDGPLIIKNTLLNIKTLPIEDKGYSYYEDLGISVQVSNANKALMEIYKQTKMNDIHLSMKIKLKDNIIINLNNNIEYNYKNEKNDAVIKNG